MPHYRDQLLASPKKLQEVAAYFDALSESLKIETLVTRVWDPVPGESGVHPAHRAIDFRDQYSLGKDSFNLYTDDQVAHLLNEMNSKFPRTDGKRVAIHHSFGGGPLHFHLQIPLSWLTIGDIHG